jgi:hypothetical protein
LEIARGEAATYRIIARPIWKQGDWRLVTARNTTKTWASPDRLAKHLAGYGNLPRITLKLSQENS